MIRKFDEIVYATRKNLLKEWCKEIRECRFTSCDVEDKEDAIKIAQFLKLAGKEDVLIDEETGLTFYYENGEFYRVFTDLELQSVVDGLE
jgi:hypothetical protein